MKLFYNVPFKKGTWYITICDVIGIIEKLPKGTELNYRSTTFSRYDGMIGFFFKDRKGKDKRWDIHEELDPIEESMDKFRKL